MYREIRSYANSIWDDNNNNNRCYSVSTGGSFGTKVYDGGLIDVSSAKHERHHGRRSDG